MNEMKLRKKIKSMIKSGKDLSIIKWREEDSSGYCGDISYILKKFSNNLYNLFYNDYKDNHEVFINQIIIRIEEKNIFIEDYKTE